MADQPSTNQQPRQRSQHDPAKSPASPFERGAADRDVEIGRDVQGDRDVSNGVGGAADGNSGAGAGSGVPGGGTDMRTDGALAGGDRKEDHTRLFPDLNQKGADAKPFDDTPEA